MGKAHLAGALLLVATQAGGCAPFVEVVKLDEAARAKARSDVRQYVAGEVPATSKVVQQLEATSCRLTLSDPPATNEDAIDQLRFSDRKVPSRSRGMCRTSRIASRLSGP